MSLSAPLAKNQSLSPPPTRTSVSPSSMTLGLKIERRMLTRVL
jgi:hypothetical protein